MREQELVGFLMGGLEESESRQVEAALADPVQGPALRRDLDVIKRALRPLEFDRAVTAAPPGLASRTLAFVAAQTSPVPVPTARPAASRRVDEAAWQGSSARQWLDRAIIAASALAACVLVAPLLLESIADSRARRAQRNLQNIAGSLQGYAESHRVYPAPPGEGPLSRAGLYAPTLVSEHRLVADDGTVLVPDSKLAKQGNFRVPTLEELRAAVGTPQFDEMVRSMGGDYGYTLGHRDASGVLQPNRDQRRAHHPLVADAPDESGEKSDNHPEGAHFILFEDGHVERRGHDTLHRDDHLYRNHDGEIRAGKDAEDAVIGDSHHQP
ncbi:MAG: hypothetical protein K8S94_12035 [Planctomycetia bacterium]|nr:hypothetical protein [Planctomycetia bacterium]